MNRNERLFELIKMWKFITKGDSTEETNFNVGQLYKRGKINEHIAELIMLSVAFDKTLDEVFPNITDDHWEQLHHRMGSKLEPSSFVPRDGLSIVYNIHYDDPWGSGWLY